MQNIDVNVLVVFGVKYDPDMILAGVWVSLFKWTETELSFHSFILRTNHRTALNDGRLDLNGGKPQVFIRLLLVLETMDYERFDVKVRGVSADEVLYFILESGSDWIWYPSGSSPRKSTAALR